MHIKLGAPFEAFMKCGVTRQGAPLQAFQPSDSPLAGLVGCSIRHRVVTPSAEFSTLLYVKGDGVFAASAHGEQIIPESVFKVIEFDANVAALVANCPVTYRAKCAFSALAYVIDSVDASGLWEANRSPLINCLAVVACKLTSAPIDRPHGFELASSQWTTLLNEAWAEVGSGELPESAIAANIVFESAFYELSMINFDAPTANGYWAYHVIDSRWVNVVVAISLESAPLTVVAFEDGEGNIIPSKLFDRYVRNSPSVQRRVCDLSTLADGLPDHNVESVSFTMSLTEFARFDPLTKAEIEESLDGTYEMCDAQFIDNYVSITLKSVDEDFDLSALGF